MRKNQSKKLSWEILSPYAALLSAFAAVIAIYMSAQQYMSTVEKTDEQIRIMQEERMRNLEEGRPYVVIDSTTVELEDPVNGYEEYQEDLFYAYKRHWTYYHHFENIGTRPAIQLTITNKVLEMDYKKWEEDYSTCKLIINDSFVLSNPLTQQFQLPRHTSIGFKKHKKYLIKTSLQYKDKLNDSLYYDNYWHYLINCVSFKNRSFVSVPIT